MRRETEAIPRRHSYSWAVLLSATMRMRQRLGDERVGVTICIAWDPREHHGPHPSRQLENLEAEARERGVSQLPLAAEMFDDEAGVAARVDPVQSEAVSSFEACEQSSVLGDDGGGVADQLRVHGMDRPVRAAELIADRCDPQIFASAAVRVQRHEPASDRRDVRA
jgi:hypothetical protein